VSPVKYELGFYIAEVGILHCHRLETLKSYISFWSLPRWPLVATDLEVGWTQREVQKHCADSRMFTPDGT
jgi:hypothetical protein